MTQVNLSVQQKWNHRCKEYIVGAKGEALGEGRNRRLGSADVSFYI